LFGLPKRATVAVEKPGLVQRFVGDRTAPPVQSWFAFGLASNQSEGSTMRDQWKPRHVVAIAFAIVLVVALAPLGVAAATGNLVNIADPERASRMARVSTTGALRVSTGAEVVSVAGAVTATEARPSMYVRFGLNQSNGCQSGSSYAIPAGKALIIKTVTSFLHDAGGAGATEGLIMTGPLEVPCSQIIASASTGSTTAETVVQNFEPGIAVPAGQLVTGYGWDNNGSSQVYGYLVPASAVPVSSPAAASRTGAQRTTSAHSP
jgi:preprotein translocase subunit Sec61beta